jgi:hypothetical protein
MLNIKELYRKNVYGVMGTLIFHILLIGGFLLAELKINGKIEKEDPITIDFAAPDEMAITRQAQPEQESRKNQEQHSESEQVNSNDHGAGSNRAINDAIKKDKFFDASYKRDIETAEKMVADVNKQLSKKVPPVKKYAMPEVTTEGQNRDSIKNTIYSGKSNIHYSLENRYHVRLPIPVYLTKGGGLITVDIQVDRSGRVIKAEARPVSNAADPMLSVYATQAAESTLFNFEPKAPSVQKGTITYKFVAQ